MSPSFLIVLPFMLGALIGPLLMAGVVSAICVNRWRQAGLLVGKSGMLVAVVFMAAFLGLDMTLGGAGPQRPALLAGAASAGFTGGAAAACAWIWLRAWRAGVAVRR